ncbi:MAG: YggS family pyridoxal phosphate-dependent enzyme [Pseudobdellovibrio sp.]|nr:YggS family pyridoxal phosphate-dependent enzyme [Pseudobdellovibrio sp.]
MKKIVLASQSPRRAEILKKAGYYFVSFPVFISEIPNENLSLDEQIIDIAKRKALACLDQCPDKNPGNIILASDTMVCLENSAIGKPESEQDAFNTLKKLSGKMHEVKTAIILLDQSTKDITFHIETSQVFFKNLDDQDIWDYIKTGEPMDKAGSYAIQGLGGKFVEKFVGDYNNVVGLPLSALEKTFSAKNWQFEKSALSQIKAKLNSDQHLLAVSKLQPLEKIRELVSQGQKAFGENYIQEALEKVEALKDLNLEWHLIGPIQKNKVKYLKNNFAYLHAIDSLELAELVSKKASEIGYVQKVFIQVNLSNEATKAGFDESSVLAAWDKLTQLTHVKIVGLMTMPPLQNEALDNQVHFKKLKTLANRLQVKELSMGTSHDYEVALQEGATWIRIGTVLFGERQKVK